MTTNLIRTLAHIGEKPGTSRRDHLTITRRVVRALCEQRQSIHAERRALHREAGKLREHLPFTRPAIECLERQAREHRAAELEQVLSVLAGYGRLLVMDQEGDAEALGFEALAGLLNINRVGRERARREGWTTLRDLIAIHDLENSADRRGAEPRSGSPLHQACQLALLEFIRTCPEHLLPDPFAPGAPFGPKLPPELRLVGK
jgi:hypothetical protein